MLLPADFREFIELLISEGIRFVMIGGYAYNLYRNPRATGDIDFFLECTSENELAAGRPKDLADAAELQKP